MSAGLNPISATGYRIARVVRIVRQTAWLAAAALGCAFGFESWRLAQALQVNGELARAGQPGVELRGSDPRVWIAAAREPARAGRTVEAAALLRRAADTPGPAHGQIRPIALYDLGNVYLRAAIQLRDKGADALALPLLELAKESYRAALLARGDLWDAKFNLELALRAAPDPDPDDAGAPPVMTGERAVTTMHALSLGLP
jgi:mxaK protein